MREVLSFPNGDSIHFKGHDEVHWTRDDGKKFSVNLPEQLEQQRWRHLTFKTTSKGRWASVSLDGVNVGGHWDPSNPVGSFSPSAGQLVFARGIHGWLDDFRVTAGNLNEEEICNLAQGSLVALTDSYTGPLQDSASLAPSSWHDKLYNITKNKNRDVLPAFEYACHKDYSSLKGANTKVAPAGAISVKNAFLFREGPFVHSASRPDSTTNQFCLRCHTSTGKKGLGIEALELASQFTMIQDTRRSPMEAPRRFFGIIPADYFQNTGVWKIERWGMSPDNKLHP